MGPPIKKMENSKTEDNSDGQHQKRNKKKDVSSTSKFPDVVELNVGGKYFATSIETLTRCKGSVLDEFFSGDPDSLPRDREGRFFIDADGVVFSHVLNYLRSNQLPSPDMVETVYNEALVLGLDDFITALEAIPPILIKICKENTRNVIPGYKKFFSSLMEWITDDCKENVCGKTTIFIAMQEKDNNDNDSGNSDQNHICFGTNELSKRKVNADLYFGPWDPTVKASDEEMLGFVVSDLKDKGFTISEFGLVCNQCEYKCHAKDITKCCRRRLYQLTVRWWILPMKPTHLKRALFCNDLST